MNKNSAKLERPKEKVNVFWFCHYIYKLHHGNIWKIYIYQYITNFATNSLDSEKRKMPKKNKKYTLAQK